MLIVCSVRISKHTLVFTSFANTIEKYLVVFSYFCDFYVRHYSLNYLLFYILYYFFLCSFVNRHCDYILYCIVPTYRSSFAYWERVNFRSRHLFEIILNNLIVN